MKIQAKLIDKFIANSLNDIESLLLYGPDAGLISERKINITKKILGENFDDLNYTHIEASSVKKDPSILDNEINSISLMQERKLIIISGCPTNFGKIAENSLNNKKSDNFIIFLASELSPSSNLRKLFENKNNLAALPCYNDDKYTVISLIKEAFPNKNLDHDVIEYIANNISGDRQLIKKEIEKLQIYFHDKKEVSFNDVVNLLVENIESDYQIFANEFMNKNFSKAIIICDDLLASGEQEISLIRALNNYVNKVYLLKAEIDSGENMLQALKKIKPPIFFKQKDLIISHVNSWSLNSIKALLIKIDNLEKTIKLNSMINASNFLRFFILLMTAK